MNVTTSEQAERLLAVTFEGVDSVSDFRRAFVDLSRRLARSDEPALEWADAGHVPVARVNPPSSDPGAVLYIHGGGFVAGSPWSHRHVAFGLASVLRQPVLVPDYPLAPSLGLVEIEAAVVEVATGAASDCDVVVADSAGGRLALDLVAANPGRFRALILLSPWLDLDRCGRASDGRHRSDRVVSSHGLTWARSLLDTTGWEPAELVEIPPTLVQVGRGEILADDGIELARSGPVTLELVDQVPHVWHQFAATLPEAVESLRSIRDFVRES